MKRGALLALALVAACAGAPAGERAAQQIIDDLSAHRYSQAGARYRQQETLVLSPEAARVWRRALQHRDTAVRELAIDALSRSGGEGDFELLQEQLRDPVRGVRQQARDALVRLDPERAALVFRELLGSALPEQVLLAAEGAAELQDVTAVPAICRRLLDADLPEPTRSALGLPLARLGQRDAIEPLVSVATDPDAGISLRRASAEAAAALATVHDREAMQTMAGVGDPYIRDLALAALALDGD